MGWLIVALLLCGLFLYFLKRRPTQPVDISILPQQFVVVDLETTGLIAGQHEIIEIGAIRVHRDSNKHDTFQALIKSSKKIPKKITELTGITQGMVDNEGISLAEAMKEFLNFIGTDRIVAYNAEFDMSFLKEAAKQVGGEIKNPSSCALKMAKRAWPGKKSYRLSDLAADGNLTTENAHRALHDCKTTMLIYSAAATLLRSIK